MRLGRKKKTTKHSRHFSADAWSSLSKINVLKPLEHGRESLFNFYLSILFHLIFLLFWLFCFVLPWVLQPPPPPPYIPTFRQSYSLLIFTHNFIHVNCILICKSRYSPVSHHFIPQFIDKKNLQFQRSSPPTDSPPHLNQVCSFHSLKRYQSSVNALLCLQWTRS